MRIRRIAGSCGERSRTIQPALLRLVVALLAAPLFAQSPETMTPEASEARGRELIQKAIAALGGQAYLQVRDMTRTGRRAQFSSQGDLGGFTKFEDFVKLPDKNRTEYYKKKNIIDVVTSEGGWTLDRGGVSESPADRVEEFRESLKKDVDILFRARLQEKGLRIRYGGSDIMDLKSVEWVEVTDRDRRTIRIALEKPTLLPMRAIYITRHPETRARTEEVDFFSNYHSIGGVETPLQLARERSGRKVYQAFIETCVYNTNLPDSLFTRESLDQRWAQLDKKKKK